MIPAIFGLAGETLSIEERAFARAADPAGFILFARNCRDRVQLRALTDSLREATERADLPILIDQEGGRVARLGPPEWPAFPAPWRFAELYGRAPISAIEAARLNAEAIAVTLAEAGINVDCAPLLDLRHPHGHDVIGDRALGAEPMQVAALGRATLDGLAAGGVCGVVKHVPGHGRARADSHFELPVIEATEAELAGDLAPFRALKDAPMAMTAHVVYAAWDEARCATVSPVVIGEIVRGRIGFAGLLVSDDLAMAALAGTIAERALAALAAGCDLVLHGSGALDENETVARALGEAGAPARARLAQAMAVAAGRPPSRDVATLVAQRDALLALAVAGIEHGP